MVCKQGTAKEDRCEHMKGKKTLAVMKAGKRIYTAMNCADSRKN